MSGFNYRQRLFVGSVHASLTEKDLGKIFGKYGPIKEISVKIGYAFVVFEDEDDAAAACDACDGMWVVDRPLAVRVAFKNRPPHSQLTNRFEGARNNDWRSQQSGYIDKPYYTSGYIDKPYFTSWRQTSGPQAAKSQPPPDRRRTSGGFGGGRDLGGGVGGNPGGAYRFPPFRDNNDRHYRSTSVKKTTTTKPRKDVDGGDSKDYRLIVNNLSSTVKWKEITEFMKREGNLILADHGRRQDCDKSCYVDFATRSGMEEALRRLDGLSIAGGKTVRVYIDDHGDRKRRRDGERKR